MDMKNLNALSLILGVATILASPGILAQQNASRCESDKQTRIDTAERNWRNRNASITRGLEIKTRPLQEAVADKRAEIASKKEETQDLLETLESFEAARDAKQSELNDWNEHQATGHPLNPIGAPWQTIIENPIETLTPWGGMVEDKLQNEIDALQRNIARINEELNFLEKAIWKLEDEIDVLEYETAKANQWARNMDELNDTLKSNAIREADRLYFECMGY